jgi:hypothetical protein
MRAAARPSHAMGSDAFVVRAFNYVRGCAASSTTTMRVQTTIQFDMDDGDAIGSLCLGMYMGLARQHCQS